MDGLTVTIVFSFGSYFDPNNMGISVLRVINDDTVAPGAGFDTHGHRDMEIISYVLEGAVEHQDSMGNKFVVPAGEVQRISAGTGITHSEFNHSKSTPVKFLQIWIEPNKKGISPSYEQKKISQKQGLTPLVTPDGREGSLSLQQDANIYRLELDAEDEVTVSNADRIFYIHLIEGELNIGLHTLHPGDAITTDEQELRLKTENSKAVALIFDLPTETITDQAN